MDGFRTYKDLFMALRRAGKCTDDYQFLVDEIGKKINLTPENEKQLKEKLRRFVVSLKIKWLKAYHSETTFLRVNQAWLQTDFPYPNSILENITHSSPANTNPGCSSNTVFQDLSISSKRRRVASLVQNFSSDELTYAACSSLYKSGKRNIVQVIKEADKYVNSSGNQIIKPEKLSSEEALSLFIDCNYTKATYDFMRSCLNEKHANVFPSYHLIREAKKDCYPTCIEITEISAEVNVQSLVDHTTQRLFKFLKNSVDSENVPESLNFLFKWGCDGSSGYSTYHQAFSDINNTDEYLFAISLVPLILKSNGYILWVNPCPSSTRFCRPIKIMFKHETNELIKNETENIQHQISNILPYTVKFNNKDIKINYHFRLTMLDGKAVSAVTESSNQSCSICKATPRMMNNLDVLKTLPINIDFYQYGISILHAWIKSMECILHISYRLELKKWQMRSKDEKKQYEEKKKMVQTKLKEEMHLLVDITKQGYGTTNTGNVARRFFKNYSTAANITGVNEELIKRLGVILVALSSYRQINPDLFEEYAMETFNIYVREYDWYYMPSSLHKILLHGSDIIKSAALPIGMFSEEAIEARNKDYRNIREDHTRKFSRTDTITDLFHTLLYTSDIFISSICNEKRRMGRQDSQFNIFNDDIEKLMLRQDDS